MSNPNNKTCYVTWSGGIDSTGVIGLLLQHGWLVYPVTLMFGAPGYRTREETARQQLSERFEMMYPDTWFDIAHRDGNFLNEFTSDGVEITRRNKHILDYMMQNFVIAHDGYYIGMGEYIGADTWAVKDHVGAHDADSRFLAAYLLHEYGLSYRLMTLADFGESRYKADRVKLLVDAIGPDAALLTSNCMDSDPTRHCGRCYKCIERNVAFEIVLGEGFDTTQYISDPKTISYYAQYQKQMRGQAVDLSWEKVNTKQEG